MVSREDNVRQVLTRVQLDQVDAGIVYTTDALAANSASCGTVQPVKTIEIPTQYNVIAVYYIAPVKGAPHPAAARTWITYILSQVGRPFSPSTASYLWALRSSRPIVAVQCIIGKCEWKRAKITDTLQASQERAVPAWQYTCCPHSSRALPDGLRCGSLRCFPEPAPACTPAARAPRQPFYLPARPPGDERPATKRGQ